MPLLIQDIDLRGFLVIKKWGLFQMGEYLVGVIVVLVIGWNFHQAVRVVAMVGFLEQGWRTMEQLMNGRSEIRISLYDVCSIAHQGLSLWDWSICEYTGVDGQ